MIKLVEIYKELLSEAIDKKASTFAIEKIMSAGLPYEFKFQTKPNRIGNMSKISSDDFVTKVIMPIFNIKNKNSVSIIPPGTSPNSKGDKPEGSTKYNMYQFDTDKGKASIILSGGKNEGEVYETDFIKRLKSNTGIDLKSIQDKDVADLYRALKINPKDLKPEDIKDTTKEDTKRQPSEEGPKNVGNIIADVTILDKHKLKYISLKNKKGSGLYNGGVIPFILEKNGKAAYDKSKLGDKPVIKSIFDIFEIDPNLIVKGLNDYISGIESPKKIVKKSINNNKAAKFLASSIGYGYYYVREQTKGLKIIPILTEKDSLDSVGKIKDVIIKYPSHSSKQTTIIISADSPIFGEIEYSIELRNTTGKILPLSVKISAKY